MRRVCSRLCKVPASPRPREVGTLQGHSEHSTGDTDPHDQMGTPEGPVFAPLVQVMPSLGDRWGELQATLSCPDGRPCWGHAVTGGRPACWEWRGHFGNGQQLLPQSLRTPRSHRTPQQRHPVRATGMEVHAPQTHTGRLGPPSSQPEGQASEALANQGNKETLCVHAPERCPAVRRTA